MAASTGMTSFGFSPQAASLEQIAVLRGLLAAFTTLMCAISALIWLFGLLRRSK